MTIVMAVAFSVAGWGSSAAQATRGLETKWVRDSETYATLTRQIYRNALEVVRLRVADRTGTGSWSVVLDVDETTLDNSAYQLELGNYGTGYDDASWNAWVARREAPAVPGVRRFIEGVRDLGGNVAWVSNRFDVSKADTRANLCLKGEPEYTKAVRRGEVAVGQGACAWDGTPMEVLAFFGDQMGDFPSAEEGFPEAGNDAEFGTRFFVLPNPMYGPWVRGVTRRR
jgi:5'-nucleotidase (lipoprotein e(P4) family)